MTPSKFLVICYSRPIKFKLARLQTLKCVHAFYGTRSGKLSLLIRLSWDLHSPSPSLMRIVIISCTGPDDPVNEDDCKMKKSPSTPQRVCFMTLITELDNMSHDCHLQAYELHLIWISAGVWTVQLFYRNKLIHLNSTYGT